MPGKLLAVFRLALLRRRGLLGGQTPSVVANVTSKVGSVDDNKSGGGYACEQLVLCRSCILCAQLCCPESAAVRHAASGA